MSGQTEQLTTVLILSDTRDIADLLMESMTETPFGKNSRICQASSPVEITIRLAEIESYSAIFCARECINWLTEDLYDHLDDFFPETDLMIVGGKSIATAVRSFLQRQHLVRAGLAASVELEDHRLALQIARQRLEEFDTLQAANDFQTVCQAVSSKIRHEINNPLTGVLGQAQLLLRRSDNLSDETRRRIETIEMLALRMSEIIKSTSPAFSVGENAPEHFDNQPPA
jgi:signal transduction histidine kinase